MRTKRPIRGAFASLLLLTLLTPFAKPVMCEGADHGNMAMEHMNGPEAAWSQSGQQASACHGQMGCTATLTPPVLERAQGPRDLPVHPESPARVLLSAESNPASPVPPPPRV